MKRRLRDISSSLDRSSRKSSAPPGALPARSPRSRERRSSFVTACSACSRSDGSPISSPGGSSPIELPCRIT